MATGAPLPVREYASVNEMRRHAAEVRARLFAARPASVEPVRPDPDLPVEAPLEPPAPEAGPEPQIDEKGFIPPKPVRPEDFEEPTAFPIRRLLSLVSSVSGIRQRDILSQRRTANVVKPRQILCWLCKQHTGLSYPQIGRYIGGRDHTTALWSVTRVQEAIDLLNIEISDCPVEMAERLWSAKWPRVAK